MPRARPPRFLPAVRALAGLALLFAGCEGRCGQRPAEAATPDHPLALQMHVRIPMRDGVRLDATIFRPADLVRPLPVIVMLTPYPDDPSHPSGAYFARKGMIYAYVVTRGRGDSEGQFRPFEQDGQDGFDLVQWLAAQGWSNGQVAMFGGSYAGGDQWQVAATHPPALSAIAPVASVRAGIDFPMRDNIFSPYVAQWLTYTSGHALYLATFGDDALWTDLFRRFFLSGHQFSRLDADVGSPNPMLAVWLRHPTFDSYWSRLALAPNQVAAVAMPVLAITGAHDADQPGTLSFYRDHLRPDGRVPDDYYLVIGPWDHGGTREPRAEVDGEHFGKASLVDLLRLHASWYRHVFFGEPLPAFLRDHVAYYVAGSGAECWKYAKSLAALPTNAATLFLDASGGADSLRHAGRLTSSAAGARGGAWISDPRDLRRATPPAASPGDDLAGDGLVFQSDPFAAATEIDGGVTLRLSLAIGGPDADIGYFLYLITPDGHDHALSSGAVRARHAIASLGGRMVKPGAIASYDFGKGQWFAIRAAAGSRLRLVVRSLNDPDVEKNWNSAKPVAEQSSADAHVERIRLIQTPAHPSIFSYSVADPSAPCSATGSW